MNKQQLFENIKNKKSFLCVGLDTDIKKIPEHLLKEEDPIFSFNKAIIDATAPYCKITPVHHTDSQGNTNTGFYIHLSLHIYGTAHPTIASNRASALHDNTTYRYKPESRPPNRIRCGMQGSVCPKLPAPCRRQTDTACLHDARHENYRIPSTIHVHLSYRYGVPNPPPPC